MTLLLGGNSSTVGFTDRCRAAAEVFGPGVMLWLSSALPADARRYRDCVHIVRLPNWDAAEPPAAYAARIMPVASQWYGVARLVILQLGNEPDLEAGHHGEAIAAYAAAVRALLPNVKIANPPLSVEGTGGMVADGCDVLCCHSYTDWHYPATLTSPTFGLSYRKALFLAAGRPVYVTECGVSNFDGVNWSDRNRLIARWLDGAAADGVAGACLFILDGINEWARFDVGPSAAAEIIALRAKPVDPVPPPPPPPPPQGYTRDTRPMHTGINHLSPAWLPAISARNPAEADAICRAYQYAIAIGYDPNLAIAQGWVETAGFTSSRWRNAHNAAGIGIYSDGTPDIDFRTAERGIQAQIELLSDYYGDGWKPWGVLKEYGFGFATPLGKTKLSDMDGVWAADTGYSAAIVAVANGVTGGTIDPVKPAGVPLSHVLDIARDHIGHTLTDEGNPEFGMCEQFVEEVLEQAIPAVPRVRYPSAAVHGDALTAMGLLHTDMPPPPGAPIVFGRAFDPEGHICYADEYPYVITTYRDGDPATADVISRIDGTPWYQAAGYMGYYVPEGIGAAEDDTDMKITTSFDDGDLKRLWDGPKTAGQKKKMPFNKDFGIPQAWAAELRAGKPLGFATSPEESDPAGHRVVQYFALGKITFWTDTHEVSVN